MTPAIAAPALPASVVRAARRVAAAAAGLALLVSLGAAPAQAQLARTFVSSVGNDANDCNRTTPCRTFQRAHDTTLAAGEITVLDPGGYGGVTITKAISIVNDGVGEAGVLVSGGANGITVSAGSSDAVNLRGLTVKGIGFGGGKGIVLTSAKSLTIENSAIRTIDGSGGGFGILAQPDGSTHLAIINSIFADNARTGVHVQPAGVGSVRVSLSRVQLVNNSQGMLALAGQNGSSAQIDIVMDDSLAAGNIIGLFLQSSHPAISLMLMRSVVSHSSEFGITASGLVTARIGQSTLTTNQTSWQAVNNAVLQSFGDNYIAGNADGDPAPPVIGKK